jgi:predicted kinase
MDPIELARECGARETFQVAVGNEWEDGYIFTAPQLAEFESRIRADEREKAAKVCEQQTTHPDDPTNELWQCAYNHVAGECASAIRAGNSVVGRQG